MKPVNKSQTIKPALTPAALPPTGSGVGLVAPDQQGLRRRATEIAQISERLRPGDDQFLSPEAMQRALHELRVHQIELEMQNEELREAQRKLDAEHERYLSLYDLAPVGYCTVSGEGLILRANLTFASMLQLARSALVGRTLTRFILTEDQDAFYRLRKKIMEVRGPQECDVRLTMPSGVHLWVHVQAVAVLDDAGDWRLRLALSDITALKTVQKNLIDSEQRYRRLADGAPTALMVHDGQRIGYVNAAAIRLFGARSATELVGLEIFHFVHPDFREVSKDRVRMLMERPGSTAVFEYKLLTVDGSVLTVEVHSASIVHDGAPAIQVVMNDVAERRDFAKRQLGAIENERKRIAREVHDQIGQVLTAVKLMVESLPRDTLPKAQGPAIMQALDMGIAATRKITAELRPRLLDDLGLTAAIEHLCDQMLGALSLDFEIELDNQDSLDPGQALGLFRIAQEALTNVLKHAVARHVTISGRLGRTQYAFRVKDDGRGFIPGTTRRDGMGLISMQERARIMGGRCTIESNLNRGTLVEVVVPLNGAHDDERTAD